MIFVLWFIVTCVPTNVGCRPLMRPGPEIRAMGTYRTFKECSAASKVLSEGIGKRAGGTILCLPTLPKQR